MSNHIHPVLKSLKGVVSVLVILFISGCGGTEVGNPGGNPPVNVTTTTASATTTTAAATTTTTTSPTTTTTSAATTTTTLPPTAESQLETYLKDQYATSVLEADAYSFSDITTVVNTTVAPATTTAAATTTTLAPSGVGSDDYSQTNTQESGVAESDRTKTDGTYMYVADDRKITIIEAVPANAMSLVSTIDVNGSVGELYLFDGILVVLYIPDGSGGNSWSGTNLSGQADVGLPYWLPVDTQTGIMLVDVSEPSTPGIIQEVRADGSLLSSRLTGGKLHVVQQYLPDLPPLELYYDGTQADRDEVIDANTESLDPLSLDDLIPFYETVDENGNTIDSGRLVAVEDFYQPDDPEGGSIIALMTFDMNNADQPFQSVGLIADAHLVYASTESLYTGATVWDGSAGFVADYDQRQQTVIHKFDLTGEAVRIKGTGRVQGQALNQFSFSEYEGVLRVATTTGRRWGSSTLSNHVYCLEETGGALETIGRLEGLAPGEKLYAARFLGPRGFLVTYVKIDPLFTLDLSDPTDPRVAGELKVPGYSDYIHPLGENHLLTIGKDTVVQGGTAWYQGVQLSIFDISDFADPTLLHVEKIGARGTESISTHKAFTFWAQYGLLAIPIDLHEYVDTPTNPWESGSHTFNGLYVYRITTGDGFEYLGRIDTSESTIRYPDWTRGVFIDDSVYAVKRDAVRSADIDDIENTVSVLDLP
ncbi:MAG: beta-propeller domain-containing protein [Desulfobacterales bacterium]